MLILCVLYLRCPNHDGLKTSCTEDFNYTLQIFFVIWFVQVTGGPHDKDNGQANPGQYQGSDPNWLDHYGNLDVSHLPGRCRYDPYRAMQDPTTACLCVATQETCTLNRDGCFW